MRIVFSPAVTGQKNADCKRKNVQNFESGLNTERPLTPMPDYRFFAASKINFSSGTYDDRAVDLNLGIGVEEVDYDDDSEDFLYWELPAEKVLAAIATAIAACPNASDKNETLKSTYSHIISAYSDANLMYPEKSKRFQSPEYRQVMMLLLMYAFANAYTRITSKYEWNFVGALEKEIAKVKKSNDQSTLPKLMESHKEESKILERQIRGVEINADDLDYALKLLYGNKDCPKSVDRDDLPRLMKAVIPFIDYVMHARQSGAMRERILNAKKEVGRLIDEKVKNNGNNKPSTIILAEETFCITDLGAKMKFLEYENTGEFNTKDIFYTIRDDEGQLKSKIIKALEESKLDKSKRTLILIAGFAKYVDKEEGISKEIMQLLEDADDYNATIVLGGYNRSAMEEQGLKLSDSPDSKIIFIASEA